ncbi:uncharacterized protein LOC129311964 [Prosopis cineraria]|uniref:uncharacterized protein LOC129311964 n=1 Tax=Prosopis cineraria TaxID=364024 RepID=UPI00240EE6FA|nr:uncharacterized protein LOC129311964 [Prosopis cineraria]
MESAAPKRPRPQQEDEEVNSEESSKRHKPYSHILSLLESDEEESPKDLSPLITNLQQEIASSQTPLAPPPAENSQVINPETSHQQELPNACSETPFTPPVMRHLLEASDDELGIPNTGWLDFGEDNWFSGSIMNTDAEDINGFASLCDGLWELEDETANYYTLLQSQLFL